jgi:putative ABC transport system permease protein
VNPLAWPAQFLRDCRFGARSLAKERAFAAIALGSLALGIGGSTAMYSVIYGVVLNPFIYKDVDRLMSVHVRDPGRGGNGSYYTIDQFLEISGRNTVFDGVIASTLSDVTWTGGGEPVRLRGNHCTVNTFTVMGVAPLIGRATAPSDAQPGAPPVAILGYRFWQRQFGGDPSVLGRRLVLNGKVRTVIGVMPSRFMWRGADVYLPDVFHRGESVEGEKQVHLLGRLKPGVTRVQAETDLRPIVDDLRRRSPDEFPANWHLELRPFKETFPSGITEALWILFGAVGLLLLIACVNVSNLLLSKAAGRQREIAIRASLGATRGRLVGQLLAESLLLGAGGGLLGIFLAYAGLRGIVAMVPPNTIPDESEIALNTPVLLFTLGVAVAAALLFGLLPALHLSGRDLVTPLKEAGRGTSAGTRQRWVRSSLVVGEVALSLMLLVGASLMIRTLVAVQGLHLALEPDRILTVRVPFSPERYPDAERRVAFLREVLGRIANLPGVLASGVSTGLPPAGDWVMTVEPAGGARDNRPAMVHQTDDGFLRTTGVVLARGRLFSAQDVNARLHNAMVNQSFARRYFPAGDALGRLVRIPELRSQPANLTDDSFQIVGVVKDALNRAYTNEILPEIYIPHTIAGMADRIFVLAGVRPEALEKAVCAQVYAVDAGQPVMDVKTVRAILDEYLYARPRFNLLLFAVFAGLGLVLALSGIYGVISHAVARQTREIGVRIALGAGFWQVMAMVLGTAAKLLAAGVLVGLAGSLASVRVLSGLVRNVSAFDPYSFASVAALLFAAGLFASFWPARRAARVDPMTALREE